MIDTELSASTVRANTGVVSPRERQGLRTRQANCTKPGSEGVGVYNEGHHAGHRTTEVSGKAPGQDKKIRPGIWCEMLLKDSIQEVRELRCGLLGREKWVRRLVE